MLAIGKTYKTKLGRKVTILAKKEKPSPTGHNFLGEVVDSGLVLFYNHKGETAFEDNYGLNVDNYKWMPLGVGNTALLTSFISKEDMEVRGHIMGNVNGFLRIESNMIHTVTYVNPTQFRQTYE